MQTDCTVSVYICCVSKKNNLNTNRIMMRRIKNGEPVFHTHQCAEYRRGQVMTPDELHEFSVQCLMEEYRETNAEVVRFVKFHPTQPDFYFVNHGRRPNFVADREKMVNVLVVL